MKTFAQLKRDLKVGTILKLRVNNHKPERNGKRFMIAKVKTNAIAYVEIDYKNEIINPKLVWVWLPKSAVFVEYEKNDFKLKNEYNMKIDFEYTIEGHTNEITFG